MTRDDRLDPPPKPPHPFNKITNPIERTIAAALEEAKIPYQHSADVSGLDFYLPDPDLFLDLSRTHSAVIAKRMAQAENVIAIQGVGAVTFVARLLRRYRSV